MYIYKKNLKWMILKEDKKTLVTKENYFNVVKNTFINIMRRKNCIF